MNVLSHVVHRSHAIISGPAGVAIVIDRVRDAIEHPLQGEVSERVGSDMFSDFFDGMFRGD